MSNRIARSGLLVPTLGAAGWMNDQLDPPSTEPPPPGIPAYGTWVTPNSVGYLGDEAALPHFLASPGVSFTPPGSGHVWTWQMVAGARNDNDNVEVRDCYIGGPLYWQGTGELYVHDCVIDACVPSPPSYLSTGYDYGTPPGGGFDDGTVPNPTGPWTGDVKGYTIAGVAPGGGGNAGWLRIENCTLRLTQHVTANDGNVRHHAGKIKVYQCDMSGCAQGCYPLAEMGAYQKRCWVHGFHHNRTIGNPQHHDGAFIAGFYSGSTLGTIEVSQNYLDGVVGKSDAEADPDEADNHVTAAVFIQNLNTPVLIPNIKIYANYLNMTGGHGDGFCLLNESGLLVDAQNNRFPNIGVAITARHPAGVGPRATFANEVVVGGTRYLGNGNKHADGTEVVVEHYG